MTPCGSALILIHVDYSPSSRLPMGPTPGHLPNLSPQESTKGWGEGSIKTYCKRNDGRDNASSGYCCQIL